MLHHCSRERSKRPLQELCSWKSGSKEFTGHQPPTRPQGRHALSANFIALYFWRQLALAVHGEQYLGT
jgi:hypothetical protein